MTAKSWLRGVLVHAGAGWGILCACAGAAPLADKASLVRTAPRVVASTSVSYAVPAIELIRDDGRQVSLPREMNDGRVVVLNFIFTTCSSFCPLSTQTLAQFQRELGSQRRAVHLMSISIDPEEDTPARLRQYAHRFGSGPGWQYYTGTLAASLAAQRAFGAYNGAKMTHAPLTLLRSADGSTWRRLDGFVTPQELLSAYRQLTAAK